MGVTKFTKEEIIKAIQDAPIKTSEYFNRPGNGLPSYSTVRRIFGSWNNAMIEAGFEPNKPGNIKTDRPTTFYVVRFNGTNTYKVGITQNTIPKRLGKYPPYTICLNLSNLEPHKAKIKEIETLHYLTQIGEKGCEIKLPDGQTECFILPEEIIDILRDIV